MLVSPCTEYDFVLECKDIEIYENAFFLELIILKF